MRIAVAGAGLIGRLVAWQLSNAGYQISVFDSDFSGKSSAAYVAAGMISPYTESLASQEIIFDLSIQSLTLWPELIAKIDPNILYEKNGNIVTCHPDDTTELHHFMQRLCSKVDASQIKTLNEAQLKSLEPELPFSHGFHLAHEGFIDTRHLLRALLLKLHHNHATFINANVDETQPYKINTKDAQYSFDWVFDCRGVGNAQHFPNIRAVRGEVIYLHAPHVHITHTIRLVHPRYPVYIVPRKNNHYIIGATEIESDDSSPVSVRSCLELLNAAYSVHTGFAEARILEMNSGLRPALPDNLPHIMHEDGLTAINGLYRHGFSIAPALLKQSLAPLLQRCHPNNSSHRGIL